MSAVDTYSAVRRFLADADVRPEFAARAMARIEAQSGECGVSYLWTSLSWLVSECIEEAEDLAAWSGLIADRLPRRGAGAATDRACALLTAAIQRAGEADVLLRELRRLVERPS